MPLRRSRGSGLPMPVAGRSLRASCPSLTRCCPRFAILASLGQQRRLPGTGSPSRPLVAQVFNLCVFPVRIVIGRNSGRGSSRIGGTRRSRCDVCTGGVCRSDRAENSHTAGGSETSFPPAPSTSPAGCGAATTRQDQVRTVSRHSHQGICPRSSSAWRRISRTSAAALRDRFLSCIVIRWLRASSFSCRARKSQ